MGASLTFEIPIEIPSIPVEVALTIEPTIYATIHLIKS